MTLNASSRILKWILAWIGSQCKSYKAGVIWKYFPMPLTSLAAAFWTRCNFEILTITLSGYRARHSPSPCHTVTSSHCCLAPWDKNQCCSFFFCGSPPSLFRSATTSSSLWSPRQCCLGMFIWIHSENVADELPAPPDDLLTDGFESPHLIFS